MKTQCAWAVVKGDHIYIKTVSDSRRAAIVNWLATEKKIMVYQYHTDGDIETMWDILRGGEQCQPVAVSM